MGEMNSEETLGPLNRLADDCTSPGLKGGLLYFMGTLNYSQIFNLLKVSALCCPEAVLRQDLNVPPCPFGTSVPRCPLAILLCLEKVIGVLMEQWGMSISVPTPVLCVERNQHGALTSA